MDVYSVTTKMKIKQIVLFTVAMLVSSSVADAAVGPRREIAIDCGDIKLSFVVADKSKADSRTMRDSSP
jgi:hypothetical protein